MTARQRPELVLIDGMNVLHSGSWTSRDRATLEGLVDAVSSWAAAAGVEAHVVLDGADGGVQARTIGDQVTVSWAAGSGFATADAMIEQLSMDAVRDRRAHVLVSDDHALRDAAGSGALRVWSTDAFVARIAAPPSGASAADGPMPPGIIADIDESTRRRLEQMRRGL